MAIIFLSLIFICILIEHCLCSLHPFYFSINHDLIALFHVFRVSRIMCLSSRISLCIYPKRVNLYMHEIFQQIYSATLHEATYQSVKVKLQGCAMDVVKCIYTWVEHIGLLGHQHDQKPIFHFTIKLINAILNQRHP